LSHQGLFDFNIRLRFARFSQKERAILAGMSGGAGPLICGSTGVRQAIGQELAAF
jgi:hypothetical protein